MSKHTPSPWTAYDFGPDWFVATNDDDSGPMLCVGGLHDQREANARLIAAAPDLLNALEKTLAGYISASKDAMRLDGEKDEGKLLTVMDDDAVVVLARAVLAAARGEAPNALPTWNRTDPMPRDGSRFWGKVGDDAIAMLWHEGFGEFVSSWRRMELAPGLTFENGKAYEDHHPVTHRPEAWMPMPEEA